jgi:hypothetical protein
MSNVVTKGKQVMETHDHAADVANSIKRWTLEVADQEGDVEDVAINDNAPLSQLLRKGLDALYGEPTRKLDDFDLVIAGVAVENLNQSLIQAGLHDHTEVVITPKHVHRG